MSVRPAMARKIQKLRYHFEEDDVEENREPQRFKGYEDETYVADTPGGNANYAIMIYDVSSLISYL